MMTTSDAIGEDGLSAFLSVRPRLCGIACRMLGNSVDAEDIVQDVWVRWQTTDRSSVRNAAAFLATATARIAINVLRSARVRRETCVGSWLPEPIDARADPVGEVERRDAIEVGVSTLLKSLSRTERSAYILREAYDYPYRDIANALRVREANARQVVTRARRHLEDARSMRGRQHSSRSAGKDDGNEICCHRRHRAHRIQTREQAA